MPVVQSLGTPQWHGPQATLLGLHEVTIKRPPHTVNDVTTPPVRRQSLALLFIEACELTNELKANKPELMPQSYSCSTVLQLVC